MAELADALDSKSGAFGRVGSTPTLGIFFNFTYEWSFFVSAQCPLLFLGDSPTVVRFAALGRDDLRVVRNR